MGENSLETLVLENGEYKTVIPEKYKNRVSGRPGDVLTSAIPGTVISVNVEVGQQVKCGDLLYVLDSMKMNNRICSPKYGIVKAIFVSAGDAVAKDAIMVEFDN